MSKDRSKRILYVIVGILGLAIILYIWGAIFPVKSCGGLAVDPCPVGFYCHNPYAAMGDDVSGRCRLKFLFLFPLGY